MLLKYLSKFSSLNLDSNWKTNFEYEKCYSQKFAVGDIIRVQGVLVDDTTSVPIPSFIVENLDTLEKTTLEYRTFPVGDYQILDVVVSEGAEEPGNYRFSIYSDFTDVTAAEAYFTVYEEGSEELENTVQIRYTNDENEFDYLFVTSDLEQIYTDIRVEGGFFKKEESYLNDTNYFRDQRFFERQLSSIPYKVKHLTIGERSGVPGWVGELVNNVLSLSDVKIDGVKHVRSEGAQVTVEPLSDLYPLSVYTIDLEETGNRFGVEIDYTGDLSKSLILTITTTGSNNTFQIPCVLQAPINVYWGDGTSEEISSGNVSHVYTTAGTYQIYINGSEGAILMNERTSSLSAFANYLISVEQWGSNKTLKIRSGSFYGCNRLVSLASDTQNILFGTQSSYDIGVRIFYNCTQLQEIPAGLFQNATEATNFQQTFYSCTSLKSIPENLFATQRKAIIFNATFERCTGITQIPDYLFSNCISATNFDDVFAYTGITSVPGNLFNGAINALSFSGTFRNTNIVAVPDTIFSKNTNATIFSSTFNRCESLTTIPTDLFRYNVNAEIFTTVFYGCNITTIPENLFRYNLKATAFNFSFAYNYNLQSIPEGLFRYNMNVVNMAGTFSTCIILSTIPAGLFRYNTKVTNFGSVFSGCIAITTIPTDIFRYNTAVTSFSSSFSSCDITSLPNDLFRYNTLVTDFEQTFLRCSSLNSVSDILFAYNTQVTTFKGTFYGSGLTEVPGSLFTNNINVTNFNETFYGCDGITDLPIGLFYQNVKVTTFQECFAACINLKSIPSMRGAPWQFFERNTAVTSFNRCFLSCKKITTIPSDLFDNNKLVTSFTACFQGCELLTGVTPKTEGIELWQREGQDGYPSSIYGETCFRDCTGLSNYNDIPSNWK